METAKKLLTTKRKVKLFTRQGALFEEIELSLTVLSGLPKVIAMGDKAFIRHGEEFRECSNGEFYRAPLPYFVGLSGH